MKKLFLSTIFTLCLASASFCAAEFVNTETKIEMGDNIMIVTTTNFGLSNSLQNNYNVVQYESYVNTETKQKEYSFVFRKNEQASAFIFEKVNLFSKKR